MAHDVIGRNISCFVFVRIGLRSSHRERWEGQLFKNQFTFSFILFFSSCRESESFFGLQAKRAAERDEVRSNFWHQTHLRFMDPTRPQRRACRSRRTRRPDTVQQDWIAIIEAWKVAKKRAQAAKRAEVKAEKAWVNPLKQTVFNNQCDKEVGDFKTFLYCSIIYRYIYVCLCKKMYIFNNGYE